MQPMLLEPSRRKLLGPGTALALVAGIFAATGTRSFAEDWPAVVFFLFCAIALVWLLLPGGAQIRMSDAGLALKLTWWRHHVPWSEIQACRVKRTFGGKMLLVKRTTQPGVSRAAAFLSWRTYRVPDIFELALERVAEDIERRRRTDVQRDH